MKLSKKQKKRFNSFAPHYDLQGSIDSYTGEYSKLKVDREKYIYKRLLKKGVDNTAVKKLIEITVREIHAQTERKNQILFRLNIALVVVGALFTYLLSNDTFHNAIRIARINIVSLSFTVKDIIVSLMIIGCVGLVIIIYRLIKTNRYSFFDIMDRETNYRCSVDDEALFWTILLEGTTNQWENNERELKKLAKRYDGVLKYIGGLVILFFLVLFIV